MSSRATMSTTRERLLRMNSRLGCADMEGRKQQGQPGIKYTQTFRIIDSEEIGLMIQAFDDDGDGEIDYNEFLVIFVIFQFR